MNVTTIQLDIPKQVFQVHGADKARPTEMRRKSKRTEWLDSSLCSVLAW